MSKSEGPHLIALQARESKSDDGKEKTFFNRIGAGFEHKDGQGFNVVLDALPVDGKIILRTPKDRLEDMRSGGDDTKGRSRKRGYER